MTTKFCASPQSSITNVDMSESPLLENWFEDHVEKDDSLWAEYLERADSFDKRIIDDWNKIVDVILVYVALFIATLTSFVIETAKQFQRDPADISNDILGAIYDQLAAQSNHTSTTYKDPKSFSTQNHNDYKRAVSSNALLYVALALSIVVSVIALAAKLWLVNYSYRTLDLVGSPYERAMKRQETYKGVRAWKMGAVINTMPLILLVALVMFGFFVHISASTLNAGIGYAVAIALALGLILLVTTSLAAAFIPSCPFNSSFSTLIQFLFEHPEDFWRKRLGFPIKWETADYNRPWMWIIGLVLWIVSGGAIAYGTLKFSGGILVLVCIPLAITFAYAMQEETKLAHKPQTYRLPHFSLVAFVIIGSMLSAAGYFSGSRKIFLILYCVGMALLFFFGVAARQMAKSAKETREIDAIVWLLNSSHSRSRPLFERVIQISKSSRGSDYKPRLLESLMPLLSSLIISSRTKMLHENSQPNDLEIYVSCLAQLSDFTKKQGSWWLLWENMKRRRKLDEKLQKKLEELAKFSESQARGSSNIKRYAKLVLDIYRSDEGKKEWQEQEQEVPGDVGSMIMFPEPAHSYYYEEPVEIYSRGNKGYSRVDTV
ncbi:hypothetical protein BYT27DRAFT_7134298 [Phlegmacium glaucopus]|nr:hypothetical protein BYT27DRAFT_7134298 [Phlegmacium glaucopus]